MNRGKSLEMLVEAIERCLSGHKNALVERNRRLVDLKSGEKREHDVVITVRLAHRSFVIAIECRDRKKPVGSPDVEAFHSKCEDTAVDKGCIVSRSGFSEPARKKAEAYRIECMTLDDALSLDWMKASTFEGAVAEILQTGYRVNVAEGVDIGQIEAWTVLDERGNAVTADRLKPVAEEQFGRYLLATEAHDANEVTLRLPVHGLRLRDDRRGKVYPIVEVLATVTWRLHEHALPWHLASYSDASGSSIAEVAEARIRFKGTDGVVYIIRDKITGNTAFVSAGDLKLQEFAVSCRAASGTKDYPAHAEQTREDAERSKR